MSAVPSEAIRSRRWPDLSLEIAESTAEQLANLVEEGVKALPRRGLEISGLLTGVRHGGEFTVDGLQPIQSDYPVGPVFRVDSDRLGTAVSGTTGAIGMYRSRTDGVLDIDEQDESLLDILGSTGTPILVFVVRQAKKIEAEARAGVWRNGALVWSDAAVPLRAWIRGEALKPPEPVRAPQLVTAPAPVIARQPEPAIVVPAPVPAGPVRRSQWVYVLAGAAAILLVLLPTLLRRDGAPVPVEVATRGRQEAPVPPQPAPAEPAVTSEPAVAPQPARQLDAVPQRASVPAPAPVAAAPQRAVAQVESSRPLAPPAPAMTGRVVRRLELPDAPLLRSTNAPPQVVTRPPLLGEAPPMGTSAAAVPAFTPTAIAPQVAPVQFDQPVLVRQPVSVAIPPDLRRLLRSEVTLQFKLGIDRSGAVTSVIPIGSLGRTEEALARAYTPAVRTWVFEPAKRNGSPVNGETTLSFRISP